MAWCLDFHASYRCHHAGACCRAGWTIPFEDGAIAARDRHGACSFFDDAARSCAIHATHGMHALPVTCRMFPRVVLHDMRGTFLSLSHFCPTAARLLFDAPGDATIVEAPAALADVGDLEGLDARGEWPPLLRAGVLMDPASYGAWERSACALLTRGGGSPSESLAALDDVTAQITAWTPGSRGLLDTVHAVFERHERTLASDSRDRTVVAITRWLAARLFGAWTAYQGDGLAATLRFLRSCLDTLEREMAEDGDTLAAIRRSDLLVVHGSSSIDLSLKR
jgi:hypothetical protein